MADNDFLDITFSLINKKGLDLIEKTKELLKKNDITYSVQEVFNGFEGSVDGLERYNSFLNTLTLSEVAGVLLFYFGDSATDEVMELTYYDGMNAHFTDLYKCSELLKELDRYYN